MQLPTRGVVIGRFMPPHNGHRFLIDFACAYAQEVTVFVCSLAHEPIPGVLRYQWMKELFPHAQIVHITEEIPQAHRNNPDSPKIWAKALLPHLSHKPDFLFASEDYGWSLAEAFGAQFVPVDPGRNAIGVSATLIRENPLGYWEYIPVPVRPYFMKYLTIHGPSKMAEKELQSVLAKELHTVFLPADKANDTGKAQLEALKRQANRFLIITSGQEQEFEIEESIVLNWVTHDIDGSGKGLDAEPDGSNRTEGTSGTDGTDSTKPSNSTTDTDTDTDQITLYATSAQHGAVRAAKLLKERYFSP
jgi:NadR type nicotinamide-nucleotide adenylyltransferase